MTAQTAVAGPGQGRAGWGVYWGAHATNTAWGPLPGRKQPAGCAEVWAAVQAMMQADTAIYIIIAPPPPPMEVYNKGNPIILGRHLVGRHADLWRRGLPSRDKLRGVYWVKSHLDVAEAIGRAEVGGHPVWYHQYNDGADALTERGVEMHAEDSGAWAMRQ